MSDMIARLAAKGVTPDQALRDIERHPDYMKIIASEDGQELLEWLADDAASRRHGSIIPPYIESQEVDHDTGPDCFAKPCRPSLGGSPTS